jgi:hypothetical protein
MNPMKAIYFFLFLILLGCQSENSGSRNDDTGKKPQLNITILLDLSDRISPSVHPVIPEHSERDLDIIRTFAEYMTEDMKERGTFSANGTIKVIFSPYPKDPEINILAQKLNVDLQKMDNKQKKYVYDNIVKTFPENAQKIYNTTIEDGNWIGSDIWRFFKNDVKDYCVSSDPNYRNILVILTDGYIYHPNSKDQLENKYAYILSNLFTKYNLRNNQNWEQEIDQKSFGLIASRSDLQDLEVLVLEVSPSADHKNDEDIIKKVLSNWFSEMNVKRFEIYNTDLPEYTKTRILRFLKD